MAGPTGHGTDGSVEGGGVANAAIGRWRAASAPAGAPRPSRWRGAPAWPPRGTARRPRRTRVVEPAVDEAPAVPSMMATTSSPVRVLLSRGRGPRPGPRGGSPSSRSLRPVQQAGQLLLDALAEGAPSAAPARVVLAGRLAAATDADAMRHAVRGDGRAHAPVALHVGWRSWWRARGRPTRPTSCRRRRTCARRPARPGDTMMSASYSRAPPGELVLGLDRRAPCRGSVPPFSIVAMSIVRCWRIAVGGDRVARLVDGDGVALALDVLDVLGRAEAP